MKKSINDLGDIKGKRALVRLNINMQSFKDYVVSEFKIEGTTSISFKFTHSLSAKIDKKTNKMLNNHTINIAVQFFDKDLNSLYRTSFRFVNNVLNKKQAKSFMKANLL